ncbi:hypothetical protein DXG01_004551 [Tephrocybe rancida]|nr:hypothetical protein DXG01_004551 [Tephrocybe rancida]
MDTLSKELTLCIFTLLHIKDLSCCRYVCKDFHSLSTVHMQDRIQSLLSIFLDSSIQADFWGVMEKECAGITGDVVENFVQGGEELPLPTLLQVVVKGDFNNIVQFFCKNLPDFIQYPAQPPYRQSPLAEPIPRLVWFEQADTGLAIEVEDPAYDPNDFYQVIYNSTQLLPRLLTQHSVVYTKAFPGAFEPLPHHKGEEWYCNALCEVAQLEFDFHHIDTHFVHWGTLD